MIFSKTFAYTLRGILYVATVNDSEKRIRIEEISKQIGIPKYFLANIMNRVGRAGILVAIKGPNGGFVSLILR